MSETKNTSLELIEEYEIPEGDPLRDLMESEPSPYSIDDRLRACFLFAIVGSSKKVGKMMNIPDSTIRWWKTRSSWWKEATRQARKQHQEQLDSMMTGVIHRSMQELDDRLSHGNTKVNKEGDQYKVPVSSDEIVRIVDRVYDKRALNRGDPTQRTERVDVNEMLNNLVNQFASMVEKHGKPHSFIDAEVVDENDNITELDYYETDEEFSTQDDAEKSKTDEETGQ